jgi:protein-tyrosine phosphatase
VLVHCRAGINRSGTIALAYVMHRTRTPLVEAARMVKRKRYMLCTNDNFQRECPD